MDKLIGVISDTHNLLRPELVARLKVCDLIIHAGDIASAGVLEELAKIQKVVAVRGNSDKGAWARQLKETEYIEWHHKNIFVIHDIGQLPIDAAAAGLDLVIYGHSHQPDLRYHNNVLYLNPGSAGPRRFKLPISMAYVFLREQKLVPEFIEIQEPL